MAANIFALHYSVMKVLHMCSFFYRLDFFFIIYYFVDFHIFKEHLKPNYHYFTAVQEHIQPIHREQAVEWILDVSKEEKCDPDVFPLAVSLIDRFLSLQNIFRQDIQSWELLVLAHLNWEISMPTAFDFLDQLNARLPSLQLLRPAFAAVLQKIQRYLRVRYRIDDLAVRNGCHILSFHQSLSLAVALWCMPHWVPMRECLFGVMFIARRILGDPALPYIDGFTRSLGSLRAALVVFLLLTLTYILQTGNYNVANYMITHLVVELLVSYLRAEVELLLELLLMAQMYCIHCWVTVRWPVIMTRLSYRYTSVARSGDAVSFKWAAFRFLDTKIAWRLTLEYNHRDR
uniref:Cyclin N-terminal domain-containing protein n=1 Tax=Heterorhabditis bacteriophora TaxID=37862 RepID=A0A1I7WW78_HETBA